MSDDRFDKSANEDPAPAPAQDTASRSPRERLDGTELTPFANENANLGTALRTIYQEAVEESIPPEMLDLLNRLN